MKLALTLLILLTYSLNSHAQKWIVDPAHSSVQFAANHMGLANIIGVFSNYEVAFEPENDKMDDLALNVSVKTASVDTRIEARDNHLKSADFFDVENHPNMIFESTNFRKKGKGYELAGNLTIKGVTKPIKLKVRKGKVVTGLQNEKRIGFVAVGTIKRSDYGMAFNMDMDNGYKLISDDIDIQISMEFIQEGTAEDK